MPPAVAALILTPPAGGVGSDVLHGVGTLLIGSILHGIKMFRFHRLSGLASPRLAAHYYDLC